MLGTYSRRGKFCLDCLWLGGKPGCCVSTAKEGGTSRPRCRWESREVECLWGCILSPASWAGVDSRLRHLPVFSCTLSGWASQQTSTQGRPQSPGTQRATQMGYSRMYWSDCSPIPCVTTPQRGVRTVFLSGVLKQGCSVLTKER